MAKQLTKEDLIYILQTIFQISHEENNGFMRKPDGLYAEDYHRDLQAHIDDSNKHVTASIIRILNRLSVDENDELLFDNKPVVNRSISQDANNAIEKRADGYYVEKVDYASHFNNTVIHVTQEDKDAWNRIYDDAKEYTDRLEIHEFYFVTSLPTANISPTAIYFYANDPQRLNECYFTMYLWYDNDWRVLGITKKTFEDYVSKTELIEILKRYEHINQEVLDKLGEDDFGNLVYNGQDIVSTLLIAPDYDNALTLKDGKLYVRDYTTEINSLTKSVYLVKTPLYFTEIDDCGVYSLNDSIDNYTMLLIEYYYRPDEGTPHAQDACMKTAIVDIDTINECYNRGMNYLLEHRHGNLVASTLILMHDNKLIVNYYHNVCIYKITGIREGGTVNGSNS